MNDIISRKEVRGCGEYNLDTIYYCAALFNRADWQMIWLLDLPSKMVCVFTKIKREIFEWRQLLKHLAFIKKKDILFALLIMQKYCEKNH